MCQDTVELVHPLLAREIRPSHNWAEWLACWRASTTTQQLAGLLHEGFNVGFDRPQYSEQEYCRDERLEFYFSIADGWASGYFQLRSEGDGDKKYFVGYDKHQNGVREQPWKLRQQLAQKAFDMLVRNFFRPQVEEAQHSFVRGDNPPWGVHVVSGRLFPIILSFFRIEANGEIRNISSRDDAARGIPHVIDFLLALICFIFKWEEQRIESWTLKSEEVARQNVEIRQRIDSAKPWAIEVLVCLNKLNLLWEMHPSHRFGEFVGLDDVCLAKLKEIALRAELSRHSHPVWETRSVATVEEAAYVGSRSARFLLEYELRKAVHNRLLAILNAEQEAEAASRKLEQLTTTTG